MPTRTVRCATDTAIFTQGSDASSVFYLTEGDVTLVVVSPAGKEAVVAMLGPRDFLGEGCLAGQPPPHGLGQGRGTGRPPADRQG